VYIYVYAYMRMFECMCVFVCIYLFVYARIRVRAFALLPVGFLRRCSRIQQLPLSLQLQGCCRPENSEVKIAKTAWSSVSVTQCAFVRESMCVDVCVVALRV